jgi:hypothetical protein
VKTKHETFVEDLRRVADQQGGAAVLGPKGSVVIRKRDGNTMRCADCDRVTPTNVAPQDKDVFCCPLCGMPNVVEIRDDLVIYRMLMPHEIDAMDEMSRDALAAQSRIDHWPNGRPWPIFRDWVATDDGDDELSRSFKRDE